MFFKRFKPKPSSQFTKFFRLTEFGPNCIAVEYTFVLSLGNRKLPSMADNGPVTNIGYLHFLYVYVEHCAVLMTGL
jgi:hypothetical protein